MKKFIPFAIALLTIGCNVIGEQFSSRGNMSWPIFRGNRSLSGYTRQNIPDELSLLWSHQSGERTISSPVVLNGTAYWCDVRGKVRGVDIEGREAFSFDLKTPVEATPMIHDSTLYIGRIDGALTALSLRSRDTLWSHYTEGQISASPNITDSEDGHIVVGSYDNYMYSIDPATGQRVNRFESGYYINGAVAIHDRHALYGSCDGWLRIVDCDKGVTTDSLELGGYIPASAAIAGDYAYLADYAGNIYELLLDDGRIKNHRIVLKAENEDGSVVSVPAASNTILYVTLSDKYIYAIDRTDGSKEWKYLLKGNVGESSPVVTPDKVVVCTKTGIVSVLDARDGELIWEYDTGEQIIASPAIVQGHLYILTTRGTLFCFGEKES